jgi:dTDP-4-amino-4,6-dideoxygalactose transaminase
MKKDYTVIHPDIDPGSGRTSELINELKSLWREGKGEGGREISALINLLTDQSELPNIAYRVAGGGAVERLATAFAGYLSNVDGLPPFATRIAGERGYSEIPLFVSAVGSATGAIYASLMAADVAGGEVITSSYNYLGVANAIRLAGATPRFVDVEVNSWCMDPACVADAMSGNTKAVVLTHLNRFVDPEPYYDLIDKAGLGIPLIQDASLAIGSRLGGMLPGVINVGDGGVTIFSLATSKCLTGLGGALVTAHDQELLKRIVAISYQGLDMTNPGEVTPYGANFKVNDMNAVIAYEQIARSDELIAKRQAIKIKYDELLAPLVKAGKVGLQDVGSDAVVTHYGVLIPNRDEIAKRLYDDKKIQIGMWHACHLQRAFGTTDCSLPISEGLSTAAAFLPFHTGLDDEDIEFICKSLSEMIGV